jgi:hypothetical protein
MSISVKLWVKNKLGETFVPAMVETMLHYFVTTIEVIPWSDSYHALSEQEQAMVWSIVKVAAADYVLEVE